MDQPAGKWSKLVRTQWAGAIRNRLLLALSPKDFSHLEPQLERLPLPVATRLVEPNTPIEHLYFLEQGVASVVATTPQGRQIEVGIIGREGLSGIPVLLGTDRTPAEVLYPDPGRRGCGSGLTTFGERWRPVPRCTSVCCGLCKPS
jgi:hypothetical protein